MKTITRSGLFALLLVGVQPTALAESWVNLGIMSITDVSENGKWTFTKKLVYVNTDSITRTGDLASSTVKFDLNGYQDVLTMDCVRNVYSFRSHQKPLEKESSVEDEMKPVQEKLCKKSWEFWR